MLRTVYTTVAVLRATLFRYSIMWYLSGCNRLILTLGCLCQFLWLPNKQNLSLFL